MTFFSQFKRLDVYRDIPKDLTEQTVTGATISVVAILFMTYLFLSEFMSYLSVETTSQLFVDSPLDSDDQHQLLQINLNITTPQIPCAVVSVDAQDVMGSHVLDVGGRLHKSRTDNLGQIKFDGFGAPLGEDSARPSEQKGEGCNIHGNMIVKMVPGNFHISAHAHADMLHMFFPDLQMNVTHYIHELSFGESSDVISNNVEEAVVSPLKNSRRLALANDDGIASYEYYIKIVPTQYVNSAGEKFDSFQYVANSNTMYGRYRLPAAYFRYELSPITVRFSQVPKPFSHFLVQICAIIGGIFTVLGLVNNILLSGMQKILKKAELNKLG